MNILIIAENFPPILNSSAKLLYELVGALIENQSVKNIILITEKNKNRPSEDRDKLKIIEIDSSIKKGSNFVRRGIRELLMPLRFGLAARKSIKAYQIDKVFIYTLPMTLGLTKIFFSNTYSILNVQDIFPQHAKELGIIKSSFVYSFFRLLQKLTFRLNDEILAQSKYLKKYLLETDPYLKNKIKVQLNWQKINTPELNNTNSASPIKLVYIGNLGPAQDILSFIENFLKIKKKIELDIYGNGSDREVLSNKLDETRPINIRYHGSIETQKITKVLQKSDFGLITLSQRLKMPILPGKLLTYLENNLPVIVISSRESMIKHFLDEYNLGVWLENTNFEEDPELIIDLMNKYNSNIKKNERYDLIRTQISPENAVKNIFDL